VNALRAQWGEVRATDLSDEAIRNWRSALVMRGRLVRAKGGKRREVEADPELDQRETKRRRQSSADRALRQLKAALNFAHRAGRIPSDRAWKGVRPFRGVNQARTRYLEVADAQRLLNAVPADLRQIVHAALVTGCRWSELRNLRAQEYQRSSRSIVIRHTKGATDRVVPLTEEGITLFESAVTGKAATSFIFTRADGTQWGQQDQKRGMREACIRAKISPPVGLHALRHTYASHLAQAGTPMAVIAAALGHRDTRMAEMHYAHLGPTYVSETVRANLPTFIGAGTKPGKGKGKVTALDRARERRAARGAPVASPPSRSSRAER
jgi:integrase